MAVGPGYYDPTKPPKYPGIQTPGYTPDYNYLLSQDPGLMAIRNNNQFSLSQGQSARDAAMRKLQYAYSGAGNRFSTMQQLDKTLKDTIFQGTKSNAAAGMLHSGEQPYMKQNAQYTHDLGQYNASMSLEDQINAALQSYLSIAQNNASSEAGGISDATDRLAQNPLYQPSSGYAQYDQALSSQYGKHIYKDMSGRFWTVDESGNTIPFTSGA